MTFSDYIDKDFVRAWPFGVLKTIHWFAPLATLITLGMSRYIYDSLGFVFFTAWNAFIVSLITWLCYIFRLNRKAFQFGAGYLFVPFALIDFIVSLVAVVCFGISSLICAIALIDSLDYSLAHILNYLLATVFCLISGSAFGYFAILVYRLIPNGQFRHLMTMVIEGHQTTSLDGQGGGGGPANVGFPAGRPPV